MIIKAMSEALNMLKKTSRTFYIPISRLDPGLKEAVTAAYLCMRAIDEIEDRPELDDPTKIKLLSEIRDILPTSRVSASVQELLAPYQGKLPEVSLQLHKWIELCPPGTVETVCRYTSRMAGDMAEWVDRQWSIETEEDLDGYTYSVAGMVGELLSELWVWDDREIKADPIKAVAFGRGLQAVNILRNRKEDLERGVDFYPNGWGKEEMLRYTQRNLQLADEYVSELKPGPALQFCKLPLALAHATAKLIRAGGNKLSRADVLSIVSRATG
ncbi:squalene/phytoene synthase family protein [Paenibacillus puerhi]|uniref:squalene/phytoene synthase family protein n=1 Tax=Paenibacillus puerhi TaxID=2692622 RepID=UPI001F16355F|nr:squalene/phytoene synthase family protein [Paenibacillus puerhi]